jgi:hypothetical protein
VSAIFFPLQCYLLQCVQMQGQGESESDVVVSGCRPSGERGPWAEYFFFSYTISYKEKNIVLP